MAKKGRKRKRTPVPLAWWQRTLAGGVGAASLVLGAVAVVILGREGAGSLALIAVGALFLLVAAVEALPTGLQLGSNKFTVGYRPQEKKVLEVVAEVQELAREGKVEEARKAIEPIVTASDPQFTLRARPSTFGERRSEILSFGRSLARKWNANALIFEIDPFTAFLDYPTKGRVVFEMTYLSSRIYSPDWKPVVAALDTTNVIGIILFLRRDQWGYSPHVPQLKEAYAERYEVPVRTVFWDSNDQYASLQLALTNVLQLPLLDTLSDSARTSSLGDSAKSE